MQITTKDLEVAVNILNQITKSPVDTYVSKRELYNQLHSMIALQRELTNK